MITLYKHSHFINSINNCPPNLVNVFETEAYHLVEAPLTNENNFVEAFIKNPRRRLVAKDECIGYSLSMFNNEQNLRIHFDHLFTRKPKLRPTFGDMISKATLNPIDGFYNLANGKGHFSFWVTKNFNFISKFTIVGGL